MNKRRIYTFQEDLAKRLKHPGFRKAWEDSEVEYQLAVKLIAARLKNKMSQRDLAKKVKTSQAAISRIEAMNANPSILFLKRLALAFNTKLTISF